jgi:hypothetical protein
MSKLHCAVPSAVAMDICHPPPSPNHSYGCPAAALTPINALSENDLRWRYSHRQSATHVEFEVLTAMTIKRTIISGM